MSPTENRRRRGRWVRAALLALGGLALLEGLLQGAAWRVWSTAWIGPERAVDPAKVLLCGAGEIFDEGVLRRAEAWPAAVGAARGLSLVHGAAPGRDSAGVLRRLPLQLTLEAPGLVVACVGVEDFRRRAAAAVAVDALEGRNAPFVWRPRLLAWLGGADRPEVATGEAGGPPFVGPWHFGDLGFRFDADGTLWIGEIPARWDFDPPELTVTIPGGAPFAVDWKLDGERLELRGDFPGGVVLLFRGAPLAGPAARAARAIDEGDWDEAEWMLRPAVLGAAPDPEALATLVELEARAGRRDAAEAGLRALAALPAAGPAALARARLALGQDAPAVEALLGDLATLCADPLLVRSLRRLPAGEAGQRVAEAAFAALAAAPAASRIGLCWLAAELGARQGRPAEAAGALVTGLVASAPDPDPRAVPALAAVLDEAQWAAAAAALAPGQRERLRSARAHLARADLETARILRENLTGLVAIARFHGAAVAFLDPDDDPRARAVRREVAAALQVPCYPCAATRDGLADALGRALLDRRP
jgi:hypothetical protein